MRRRELLLVAPGLLAAAPGQAQVVRAGTELVFPRDFGSHPDYRREWWYITGMLEAAGAPQPWGFQVTFFRARVDTAQGNPSAFAARQLVLAHAAVTDLATRRHLHEQRIARTGFDIARVDSGDTRVKLRDWTLERQGPVQGSDYQARINAQEFAFDLRIRQTQPVLLQGQAGYSRKGPEPAQASYYYSKPQLAVLGRLTLQGRTQTVRGTAWLDHEWSEAPMHPDAVGWDWIGMNLDDGSALMAIRMRKRDGAPLWAAGSFRTASGALRVFEPDEVRFTPGRRWTSPNSRAEYPVKWRVDTPAGAFDVVARLDDQELDWGESSGTVYWEGLSDLVGATGQRVGRGYLEMTGYAAELRF